MAIESVWCPVLQGNVTRVTSLEGEITALICPEYDEQAGTCRVKAFALQGGPLTQLLEHVAEHTLDRPGPQCNLR
jgi:hypothetical protein